ncbi:hypothetical protein BF49_5080 [Bradyrhizobium sp.]|nr:hypothetical protein BF49_5080 [Bradyrhizobium sp.]
MDCCFLASAGARSAHRLALFLRSTAASAGRGGGFLIRWRGNAAFR